MNIIIKNWNNLNLKKDIKNVKNILHFNTVFYAKHISKKKNATEKNIMPLLRYLLQKDV